MAFGTGTHETTQLVSRLLDKIARKRSLSTVLDVGCGTGVLAILAEKMGAEVVQAIDNDAEARRVARENVERNDCQSTVVEDFQIEEASEQYDLVLANIIDGILIKIGEPLVKTVKMGGLLLVSGILAEREEIFFDKFVRAYGLKIVDRRIQGDWLGLVLKHSSEG